MIGMSIMGLGVILMMNEGEWWPWINFMGLPIALFGAAILARSDK